MLSQVRSIAFDAVGTLIYPDPPVAEVYARVGRRHGSRLSAADVRQRFRDAFQTECEGIGSTSEADERRRWRRIIERTLGLENIEPCFEELFAHFGNASSWRCFSDVKDALSVFRERGFDLVLSSNFDRRLHAICRGHPELSLFSTKVISSEVGMPKPAPAFYRALLEQSGLRADEILMVGDDWRNDVLGARNVGMPAIYLDRSQRQSAWKRDNVPVISSLRELSGLLP